MLVLSECSHKCTVATDALGYIPENFKGSGGGPKVLDDTTYILFLLFSLFTDGSQNVECMTVHIEGNIQHPQTIVYYLCIVVSNVLHVSYNNGVQDYHFSFYLMKINVKKQAGYNPETYNRET